MANAAVFMLIANDGRADQMIMATSLLHARIDDVRGIRMDMGHDDINPTLADIERTHLLFMNATFKPFAAFGFEYQKVQPTGSIAWGGSLKYSIPQAGDFFADMGIYMTCTATQSTGTAKVSTNGGVVRLVDAGGANVANAATPTLMHKWCDFPGERAVANAKFTVNSNTLHEYDQHATAMWRKFKLPKGKETAYKRMVGHETPQQGYGRTMGNITAATAGSVTDILGNSNATPALAHRGERAVLNGLQTPKKYHPAATFWHKCQFWFNSDPRLMVPSVSIPYGQRFVEITLAAQNAMVQTIGTDNIYRVNVTAARFGTNAVNTLGPAEVDLLAVSDYVTTAGTTTGFTGGALSTADLYVNNVYVLPDIHDIYIHRIGFNLIRVIRSHTTDVTASAINVQLHNLKWPIEAIYFGIQPTANITPSSTSATSLTDWWRLSTMTRTVTFEGSNIQLTAAQILAEAAGAPPAVGAATAMIHSNSDFTGAGAFAAAIQGYDTSIPFISETRTMHTYTSTMGDVTLSLHGTKIYDAVPDSFFSDYMPVTYGCNTIVSNDDVGSHALFFGFYPGTYQPSGHVNISRARELYFATTPTAAGTLIAVADAINFLLISDGNAILRYTT
jgi:hypothetical protein